jgi:hypothetical protein
MAIHKIFINDFISDNYELIAIHTTIDDYKLAYLLNSSLGIQLKKNENEIEIAISEGKSTFINFIFEDVKKDIVWSLIANKTTFLAINQKQSELFGTEAVSVYLLPEFKKVDYFLKIENIDYEFDEIKMIAEILRIKNISSVYAIDKKQIKSKNNLIF